jgi:acetate kinase
VKILVLNCGSSSLKFQLVDIDEDLIARNADRAIARGIVENIGGTAILKYEAEGHRPVKETREVLEHKEAVQRVLDALTRGETAILGDITEIGAVGHRIVHGGERFSASVLIDDQVLAEIEECIDLAPLHNPPNIKGYLGARGLLGAVPQVAVFDTSFHQTMDPVAYLYGLPYVLYERHAIRRYGFHGTSHRFVSARAAEILERTGDQDLKVITCHLGNGCSIAAIRGGRSVDTSMGFTPLEGLLMGTRSGDLDPAILLHLSKKEELGPWELNALLNKHSGLLGVSGVSNDMRSLLEAEAAGNVRAKLAIDMFCYRLKKYIAAYVGVLGGVDALVFAGGIGENSAPIRARSTAGLATLGIAVDPTLNDSIRGVEANISQGVQGARVFVIPTNEELLIARDTYRIVSGGRPS